jgi:hypothetical protein
MDRPTSPPAYHSCLRALSWAHMGRMRTSKIAEDIRANSYNHMKSVMQHMIKSTNPTESHEININQYKLMKVISFNRNQQQTIRTPYSGSHN